ncbi:YggS family pyridoxal phosphate-dependent enzyme [Candidatus Woesearchaeota archaeon]|nr:YggS family pyridoxal phosphate-dependent enzyme [Candidatus Woesearchaeota archaeon]
MGIKNSIREIKKQVPKGIEIIAATKKRTTEEIMQALKAGISVIGENYVQEAEEKFSLLGKKARFHLIGHLQTNKAKKAVSIFDMIQTVDSEKLAMEIDKQCSKIKKLMPVLIEVNIGKEKNKSGCLPEDVERIAHKISTLKNLRLRGIMAMAPYFRSPEKARPYFRKARQLFDRLKSAYHLDILSMGMSGSYKIAVEEGATMVRIGTAIFGNR